jgi:hypothetical protein
MLWILIFVAAVPLADSACGRVASRPARLVRAYVLAHHAREARLAHALGGLRGVAPDDAAAPGTDDLRAAASRYIAHTDKNAPSKRVGTGNIANPPRGKKSAGGQRRRRNCQEKFTRKCF